MHSWKMRVYVLSLFIPILLSFLTLPSTTGQTTDQTTSTDYDFPPAPFSCFTCGAQRSNLSSVCYQPIEYEYSDDTSNEPIITYQMNSTVCPDSSNVCVIANGTLEGIPFFFRHCDLVDPDLPFGCYYRENISLPYMHLNITDLPVPDPKPPRLDIFDNHFCICGGSDCNGRPGYDLVDIYSQVVDTTHKANIIYNMAHVLDRPLTLICASVIFMALS